MLVFELIYLISGLLFCILSLVLFIMVIKRMTLRAKYKRIQFLIELIISILCVEIILYQLINCNWSMALIYILLAIYYGYSFIQDKKQYKHLREYEAEIKKLEEEREQLSKEIYKQYAKNLVIEGEFVEIPEESDM